VIAVVIAALGVWTVISPLVLEAAPWNGALNNVLVGLVIAAGGGYDAYRLHNDVPSSPAAGSLVAILGCWLLVSPSIFSMTGTIWWSTLSTGATVTLLAGYATYRARGVRRVVTDRDRSH